MVYQARTRPREDWELPVKRDDDDHKPFILVVGQAPHYRVVGWIFGSAAKRPEWWRADMPRPCFLVPQAALNPIEELP